MTTLKVHIGIYYGRYLVTPTGESIDLSFWPSVDDSIYINKRIAVQCINNCVQEIVIIEEEDYHQYSNMISGAHN